MISSANPTEGKLVSNWQPSAVASGRIPYDSYSVQYYACKQVRGPSRRLYERTSHAWRKHAEVCLLRPPLPPRPRTGTI